ncbi:MAG TPA: MFS transporter [Gemmataceae bacterium]|nr:MFS transporter [Gemmataceae bacterium]
MPVEANAAQHPPAARVGTRRLIYAVIVLFGINTMNFYDRQVLGVVNEPVRKLWHLSDTELGLLGTAFVLLYAVVGLPLGWWADVGRRKVILAGGVLLWSAMTALSGLAWNFGSLFAFRLGVGVGEASCAPAANSLLGDLFPRQQRARAISLFMLGLPVGLGLSFIVSGELAQRLGWRAALFVAGMPGLLLGLLALALPEPPRGAAEAYAVGAARREGSPLRAVLRIPTMWWIILSGALHNFNMYAFGHFLVSLLERYHGQTTREAGWIAGVVYGCFGGLGILWGGWLCDWAVRRRVSGRLEVATLALLVATPCLFLALRQPPGYVWAFAAWLLPACTLLYFYYAGVYATIQDIVEPSLRGTAMALYFFAMYLLGAALGPYATGRISDYFAGRAAETLGLPRTDPLVKAIGLHDAMHVVPLLSAVLVVVMFAASRTVQADHEKLQRWIRSHHPDG